MSTTGWPRRSRSLRTLPFTPLHKKSGAGRGTAGVETVPFDFDVCPSALKENQQNPAARKQIQRRFIPSLCRLPWFPHESRLLSHICPSISEPLPLNRDARLE